MCVWEGVVAEELAGGGGGDSRIGKGGRGRGIESEAR